MDSTNPNNEANSSTPPTQIENTFKLNPNAQEWTRVKQEDRCLFLTLSKHNTSTTTRDIHTYFTKTYGDCLQSIVMFGGQDSPLCAKVLFKSSIIPMMFLDRSNEVYIHIKGQRVLCKKYDPKKKQHH
ncbi:uncharacterized protein LOC127135703 [Lathyrus oleraceus]|nr:uncharacterized protein LOC127135703 [Pisum sativum]